MEKRIQLLGVEFQIKIKKYIKKTTSNKVLTVVDNAKLNFGPGPNWKKPNKEWLSVDVEPDLGDIIINFKDFEKLPLKDNSIECVYGSHVFEHMSIFTTPKIFREVYRVLKKDGVFRLILPDAEKSIKEYLDGNKEFLLFKRRKERAMANYSRDYTIFECLKEDFLSASAQTNLLGENSLAHQNAWDFETIKSDLILAGFHDNKVKKMGFKNSQVDYFSFEGAYPSEANEDYRSLYVEAIK
ncbi:methyltransferase domain-containing protein [Mariniflexile soesokkakense]|uniref:Methyltransferase domain-containing protein n=1 Tax=Mariniflexile soesokkakense TaxID=1343160 RepID=A0ABV0AAL9_9FLAO